jgi:Zn-dependent alcohol dehydrogenase
MARLAFRSDCAGRTRGLWTAELVAALASTCMASEVRGVIAPGKGELVRIETVGVPDPGPGEALVSVQACGVCHTDLHYREGGIGDDFPYLLGHEAAGTVDAVGPDVTAVAPGDFVVLNLARRVRRVPRVPSG